MPYIMKVEADGKYSNRKKIELDDGTIISVHNNVAKYYKLRELSIVKIDNIKDTLKNQELTFAKDYSLYLIGQSPRSRKQIVDKMKRKGYETDIINSTIEFLDEYGLIDDKEYAKNYINNRSNKYGSNKIRFDLRTKGINDDILEQAYEETDEVDEYENALELGRQRLRAIDTADKAKAYRRLGGYLGRRGYHMGIVKRVLSELLFSNDW